MRKKSKTTKDRFGRFDQDPVNWLWAFTFIGWGGLACNEICFRPPKKSFDKYESTKFLKTATWRKLKD